MPALPKPRATVVRRNAANWRMLPAAEPFDVPPPLPERDAGWLDATRRWWGRLWSSPMGSAYLEADLGPLVRLAELEDARARGTLSATGMLAMTALEDRFGISPKARRALQWEVAQAEREQESSQPADVPKLYAVDG